MDGFEDVKRNRRERSTCEAREKSDGYLIVLSGCCCTVWSFGFSGSVLVVGEGLYAD